MIEVPNPSSRPWPSDSNLVEIGLNLVMVSMIKGEPSLWVVDGANELPALPYGPYNSLSHRTMTLAAAELAKSTANAELSHIEQLYTFGDQGRIADTDDASRPFVSVGYMGLIPPVENDNKTTGWYNWYKFFPWEDWRTGKPEILDSTILPRIEAWLLNKNTKPENVHLKTQARVNTAFGSGGEAWNDELVLERYELIYAAGLASEAHRGDGLNNTETTVGTEMAHDHRRILATAISRLRGKLKYRPVAFELMAQEFSLFELQNTVEAITGRTVHKQNFRRSVEKANLVEPTGTTSLISGGRPAALYRFRREAIAEYAPLGLKIGRS